MDKGTFRILLLCLAAFEIALIAGSILLLSQDKVVPDWMSTAIAAVITGILGLAVHQNPDEPVQVQQVLPPIVAPVQPPAAQIN